MHEFSLARGIIETAIRHAEGRPVTAVGLRVGALRQVVPDTLAFAFELAARDTPCAGARLEQELVLCRLRCPSCELEWTAAEPDFRCSECGSPAAVLSGDELLIEWITVDDGAREG
jgi:hydrogenase nickel incorporation protein HypA/HybF